LNMRVFFYRRLVTPLFLLWFSGLTLLHGLTLPLSLVWARLKGIRGLAPGLRWHVYLYGRFLLAISWPLLRIRRSGMQRRPEGPAIYVLNHRSAADAFFATCYAPPQTLFLVRSWPFKIPFYGWFMRAAGYIDIEHQGYRGLLQHALEQKSRESTSYIVFPEGHRSRDGRLHRFHRGAFELATHSGFPVVPVCLQGTERFCPVECPRVEPALVTVTMLEPIYPNQVQGADQADALRQATLTAMREFLNETVA
jgi:1-acyl-sn-glycerol-3-phosphate acyltransferase